MTAVIGTGPYMLKERKPDQYIQLVRFDGYESRPGEADGYGGARHQYLDEIRFVPVPDPNTRVEAAISGQYAYVDSIPVEAYERVKSSSASKPIMLNPSVSRFSSSTPRKACPPISPFARQWKRR